MNTKTWMNIRIIILSQKSQIIKDCILYDSIYIKFYECQVIYSDKAGQWLLEGKRGEKNYEGIQTNLSLIVH